MERDPVCGMNVGPKAAAASTEHEGKTHHFGSPGRQRQFESDPAKYARA